MKLLYTHENRLLVWNVKNLLERYGIECTVKNEFAVGAIGDLSPLDAWLELWVDDGDYEKGKACLDQHYRYPPAKGQWRCQTCHELNEGSFEICWRCGQDAEQ